MDYPQDPLQTARTWLEAANHGDPAVTDALLTLASDHKQDYELYVGVLTLLATEHAGPALERDPLHAQNLLRALAEHVDGDDTHRVQFGEAAVVVTWLHGVCAYAASQPNWDLLEEAAHAMCTWDGAWDQWNARDRIRPWLLSLEGDAAAVMASVLRDHADSARHFSSVADERTADPRIRQAVRESADPRRDQHL
ncbi:hypothetical protein OG772_36385 [Streptomyces sp. NBC_01321]|uniref:hypothetical protein n=1 Tax=Streptomyces sp. NBC_01321 TaxID=2903825 RepID=UPI002E10F51C|nr:hypothetical protein OG772_36385 [Streptomyces sp. NBC_01321]